MKGKSFHFGLVLGMIKWPPCQARELKWSASMVENMEEAMRRSWQLGSRVVRELGSVSQKSRKLPGPILVVTIPFTSSPRQGSRPSNFAILLVFSYIKNMFKDQLFKKNKWQFWQLVFGPEAPRDFQEKGPRTWNLVDTEFKPRFDHKLDLYMFHVSNRWFNSSAALVLDELWKSGWKESWEGLLVMSYVSTSWAEVIVSVQGTAGEFNQM